MNTRRPISLSSAFLLLVALLLFEPGCHAYAPGSHSLPDSLPVSEPTETDDDTSAPADEEESQENDSEEESPDDGISEDDSDDTEDTAPPLQDTDEDGVPDADDCEPNSPSIHPGAPELCDGLDNNCDGALGDGEDGSPDERDQDGDLIVACAGDCDDLEATTYPGAPETCDGIDSNCDGVAEQVPTGSAQEMFITSPGRLYVTVLSVEAGCDIYLTMDAPVVIADMVGEVHPQVGTEVDVGAVTSCSEMRFTSTSCANTFSTLDASAFQVIPLAPNHWRLEHEDGFDNDYNDVVFEALVEERGSTPSQ